MKAAVLEAMRVMTCKEVPVPVPASDEVLVEVAYCGVCGSDVPRFLDGAVHSFPLVLGHEFSGTVAAVGGGADEGLVGKRVAGIPLVPCMSCPDCEAGNYSLCKQYSFIGSRRSGAYAQYVAVPQANVYPIGDDVGFLQAAFFEPATVAQHAINLVSPKSGATAVVAGCGTIGIFTAQILQDMGLQVTALGRRRSRLDTAIGAGVRFVADTSIEGWDEALKASLPKGGFDYVFDTSGRSVLMVKSLDLAANKATVCMIGTPKSPMQLTVREWENINRKELVLTGGWMSYSSPFPGSEWDDVAERFARGVLKVTDEMIDTICTLEEIPDGMMKFASSNSVSGKMLVKCN